MRKLKWKMRDLTKKKGVFVHSWLHTSKELILFSKYLKKIKDFVLFIRKYLIHHLFDFVKKII